MTLEPADWDDLRKAKALLTTPGFAARITQAFGASIEKGFRLLPDRWHQKVGAITRTALEKAVNAAVLTLKDRPGAAATNGLHKLAVAATGGVGGFFGLAALAVELPISTTIMLRSIADIARSEGEDIASLSSKMACIEVFALGGPGTNDDAMESGYFAVRAALAQTVTKAAEYIAEKGIARESAPVLVRFLLQVAERFSIPVSAKAAAQAVPALGAVGGALVNTLFMDHFQDMARGHFIIRRLERKYGEERIKEAYDTLSPGGY